MNEQSLRQGDSKCFRISGVAGAAAAHAYDVMIESAATLLPLRYFDSRGCAITSTNMSESCVATMTTTYLDTRLSVDGVG